MKENTSSQYLATCKEYYDLKIIPANSIQAKDEDYKKIKALGENIIHQSGINEFAGFFREGQYFIQLWTAHLILENTTATEDLKKYALSVIKDYSDNPLAPIVSEAEAYWLKQHYPNA